VNGGEVFLALFELLGACSNEVVGGEWFDEIRDKEGGHCNVERQNGFHTMCHIEGGVPRCLASGGAVCPKDEGGNCRPPRRIAVACFDQRIAYGSVLLLHDAIGSRVVS
jgi:hypothetical protein